MSSSSLPPDSYTARRLEHATPEHIHRTTHRTFIGPIPEGWLKSHRKQGYKQYFIDGGRRAPTFTAATTQSAILSPVVSNVSADTPSQPSNQSAQLDALQQATTSTTSLLHSQRASVTLPASDPKAAQDAPIDVAILWFREDPSGVGVRLTVTVGCPLRVPTPRASRPERGGDFLPRA